MLTITKNKQPKLYEELDSIWFDAFHTKWDKPLKIHVIEVFEPKPMVFQALELEGILLAATKFEFYIWNKEEVKIL